ncbi:MAG: hypothetical protein IIC24_08540 [Chloroflexi bacterium]|nr:hypothetical protein [Chloroflexota bacterium]
MADNAKWDVYQGSVAIPSETDRRNVTALIDRKGKAVTLRFDEPVAGSREWVGGKVKVVERLKYDEIQFATNDLPQETVELTWKFNAGKFEDTIAGVVIAKPNSLRISGEKGFILKRTKPSVK